MTLQDALVHLTWWAYVVCLGYLAAITALFLLMLIVAAAENRVRAFETRLEDFDTLLESPFTIPVSVVAEVLAPIVQVLALLTIPLAAVSGLLRWDEFARFLAVLALGSAVFTNAAILLQDRTLRSLYRPIIFYAQFKGFVDFLRGDRAWHKFARNRR